MEQTEDNKPTHKQKDNLPVGQLIEKFQKIKEERFKTKTKRVVTTFGNPKTSSSQKDAFIQQDLMIAEAQFKNLRAAEQEKAEARRMSVPSIFHPFKETLPTTTDSLEDIPEEVAKVDNDPMPPGKRFSMPVVLNEYSKKDMKDLEKADVSNVTSKPLIEELTEEKIDPKEWMCGRDLKGYYSNIWERSGSSSRAQDKSKANKQSTELEPVPKEAGLKTKPSKRSKGASKSK